MFFLKSILLFRHSTAFVCLYLLDVVYDIFVSLLFLYHYLLYYILMVIYSTMLWIRSVLGLINTLSQCPLLFFNGGGNWNIQYLNCLKLIVLYIHLSKSPPCFFFLVSSYTLDAFCMFSKWRGSTFWRRSKFWRGWCGSIILLNESKRLHRSKTIFFTFRSFSLCCKCSFYKFVLNFRLLIFLILH